jgi:hypothetical protein
MQPDHYTTLALLYLEIEPNSGATALLLLKTQSKQETSQFRPGYILWRRLSEKLSCQFFLVHHAIILIMSCNHYIVAIGSLQQSAYFE